MPSTLQNFSLSLQTALQVIMFSIILLNYRVGMLFFSVGKKKYSYICNKNKIV